MHYACAILKRMKKWARKPQKQLGFTVVETLVVLAVTSGLFIISAVVIDGRQNKTDFQIGTRAIQQQLQQIINETASGYYPNNGNIRCSVPMAGPNVDITSGATALGQNSDCIFAGKTIVFNAANPDTYSVYSLAGRRQNTAGEDVASPQEAWITAIPNSVTAVKIPNNLQFYRGRQNPSGPWEQQYAVAFLPNMANFKNGSTALAGSQQVELHGYYNWAPLNDAQTNIDSQAGRGNLAYPSLTNGVSFCLESGGTDQSALYTISSGLEVRVEVKNGKTCS